MIARNVDGLYVMAGIADGLYWVKEAHGWTIGQWASPDREFEDGYFMLPGDECTYSADEFTDIDERKLEHD